MEAKKIKTDTAIRRKELRRWIILELDRKPPTLKMVMDKFEISFVTAQRDMVAYNKELTELDTAELDAAVISKLLEAVKLTEAKELTMKELSALKGKKLEVKADIEGSMQVGWRTLEVIPKVEETVASPKTKLEQIDELLAEQEDIGV